MAQCKAAGCTMNVNDKYGMCRKHWFQVPYHLREKIWESVGTMAQRALWQDAVDHVARREGVNPLLEEEG